VDIDDTSETLRDRSFPRERPESVTA